MPDTRKGKGLFMTRRSWYYRLVDTLFARHVKFKRPVTKQQALLALQRRNNSLIAEIWAR